METSEQSKLWKRLLEPSGGFPLLFQECICDTGRGCLRFQTQQRENLARAEEECISKTKKKEKEKKTHTQKKIWECSPPARQIYEAKCRGLVNQSVSFLSSYSSTLYSAALHTLNDILQRNNNNNNNNNDKNNNNNTTTNKNYSNNSREDADHLTAAFTFHSPWPFSVSLLLFRVELIINREEESTCLNPSRPKMPTKSRTTSTSLRLLALRQRTELV